MKKSLHGLHQLCRVCGQKLNIGQNWTKHRRSLYDYVCKSCSTLSSSQYYATPASRFGAYKRNAGYRGHVFSLTWEEFKGFWGKSCTFCGSSIQTIGLDRIDSKVGYVLGNVVSCCWICNKMKSDLPQDVFISQCKKISEVN